MKRHSFAKGKRNTVLPFIIGALLPPATLLLFSFTAAFILTNLKDPMSLVGAASLCAIIISAMSSGFVSAKFLFGKKLLPPLIFALCLSLMIFAISMIWGGGGVALRSLLNVGIYMGTSFLFAALGCKEKKRKKYGK